MNTSAYRDKGQGSSTLSDILLAPCSLLLITGESGSGKSTLLKDILHKYLNDNKAVAYLPQQPHLFKTSIRNNVALFREIDDASIRQALHEVGLDFNLDDKVEGLSRGQLQRLGLTRVLVAGASLLILDEPTAALDVDTKQIIINAIVRLKQRYTLIIATHDPKLIRLADKVIDLDKLNRA